MNQTPLDQLSFATFRDLVKTRFRVEVAPARTVELELVEAELVGKSASDAPNRPRQESFSIIFSGANKDRLGQKTYRFSHDKIGSFDLFIVPIAAEGETIRYQAVFNRLLAPG